MVSASVALQTGDRSDGRHLRLLICYMRKSTRQSRRDTLSCSVHLDGRLVLGSDVPPMSCSIWKESGSAASHTLTLTAAG
jgi:hypothetical protein